MRRSTTYSLTSLCRCFGITTQAFYKNQRLVVKKTTQSHIVIDGVESIRHNHKSMGGRKLYDKLKPVMGAHDIKLGRDGFFRLLREYNLLIKRKKRFIPTTNSYHKYRKYPNLIRTLVPEYPNQVWVSDLTYWRVQGKYYYASFITDLYSKKIVGFQLGDTMEAVHSVKALKNAIANNGNVVPEIHHSDRGIQYCCADYVDLLRKNDIAISMTESGNPLENAVAERVNGIIKHEYLYHYQPKSFLAATRRLAKSVRLYNTDRQHMSIGNLTPSYVHDKKVKVEQIWTSYYVKKTV